MKILRATAVSGMALLMGACASNVYQVENPSCEPRAGYAKYGRDGHQDTTYIVAVMAGHSAHDAALLSFYNQAADDVWFRFSAPPLTFWGSVTDWGYRHRIIGVLHSLHSGDAGAVTHRQQSLASAIARADQGDPDYYWQTGLMLHALGDSFAHTRVDGTAYGELYGHAFDGHTPDIVGERPELYLTYVQTMFDALSAGASGDEQALEDYKQTIRGLMGSDPDAFTAAIHAARAQIEGTPVFDCEALAERLTMREVSAFLRRLEGDAL